MHVGCDAAECHHHILGYLKIDLPASLCACVHCSPSHRPGACLLLVFHALISLIRRAASHAVLQYKKWS